MPVSRRTTIKALGVAGATTALSGQVLAAGEHKDDERKAKTDDKTDDKTDLPPAEAAIRVAHFSPDAPNVDIYIDGEQVLADVPYGTVSQYLAVEPGTYTVTITAAGDPETVAFEGEVVVESAFYTIAAIGELEASTFEPLILVDAASSLIRLAHAAPDAPAVDVVVEGTDEPLFENVAFGEATDYLPVPAGEYTLEVRPAGEPEAVASFDVELELGTAYTGYAIGLLEPGDFEDRAFTLEVTVDN